MKTIIPVIKNINEVLPLIEGKKEFIVVEKHGYTVINYIIISPETFPAYRTIHNPHTVVSGEDMFAAALQQTQKIVHGSSEDEVFNRNASIYRELRGIKFHPETGEVLARPFHKFFNLNERADMNVSREYFLNNDHVILEKLDGSMVHPIPIIVRDGAHTTDVHVRWCTKMGITSTAMNAECFVAANPHITDFALTMMGNSLTPIFEWESPKDQIVVRQREEKMTLTAIRHNVTGLYAEYDQLVQIAERFGIPVVKALDTTGIDFNELVTKIREYEDSEGVVIRFKDGGMIKVKSDWYVQLHRAKDLIRDQRNVVEVILGEKLDDLLPVLEGVQKEAVLEFSDQFLKRLDAIACELDSLYFEMKAKYPEKRDFAIQEQGLPQATKSVLFKLYDSPGWNTAFAKVKDMTSKSLSRVESYTTFKDTMKLPDLNIILEELENGTQTT